MKVIQLLNWKLESIEKELENIKKQGFDAIQINPMQPFKEEKEFKWWSSYQPLGFRIGNMYGDKTDLISLCNKAKKYDLDIIVDVVLNHTANKSATEPCKPHETVDKILRENNSFWKPARMVNNWGNRYEEVTYCIGLPGLDLNNKELQTIIFSYLEELRKCGVSGFRFDAAKHIGLPSDGVDFFKKVKYYLLKNKLYGYGEFLGGDLYWRNEMSKYIGVHMSQGSTISKMNRAVMFNESHDTYLNGDINPSRTLTDNDLIFMYNRLRNKYKNTLIYTRPLDEDNPYCKNKDNLTIDEVYKLNENEYFNRLYLENNEIKEINNIKKLIYRNK